MATIKLNDIYNLHDSTSIVTRGFADTDEDFRHNYQDTHGLILQSEEAGKAIRLQAIKLRGELYANYKRDFNVSSNTEVGKVFGVNYKTIGNYINASIYLKQILNGTRIPKSDADFLANTPVKELAELGAKIAKKDKVKASEGERAKKYREKQKAEKEKAEREAKEAAEAKLKAAEEKAAKKQAEADKAKREAEEAAEALKSLDLGTQQKVKALDQNYKAFKAAKARYEKSKKETKALVKDKSVFELLLHQIEGV